MREGKEKKVVDSRLGVSFCNANTACPRVITQQSECGTLCLSAQSAGQQFTMGKRKAAKTLNTPVRPIKCVCLCERDSVSE